MTRQATKSGSKPRRARQAGALLLIEDDKETVRQLKLRLRREGYTVDSVARAVTGAAQGTNPKYDVIILDYFLPDGNGEEVCAELRAAGVDTPVLMVTARSSLLGKVSALDQGADDYLTKPFAFEELLARLRALQRRGRSKQPDRLISGDLTLERESRTVRFDGRTIELSPLEFDLLAYLVENANRTLSRQEILAQVWQTEDEESTNTIDVYIRYLRKKIWGSREASPIRTMRRIGYHYHD